MADAGITVISERQVSGLNAPHVVLAIQYLLAAARAYWNRVARTRALARIIVVVFRVMVVMGSSMLRLFLFLSIEDEFHQRHHTRQGLLGCVGNEFERYNEAKRISPQLRCVRVNDAEICVRGVN